MKNKSTYIWLFMALFTLSLPVAVFAMEQEELSDQEIGRRIAATMSAFDLDRRDENGKTSLHRLATDNYTGPYTRVALRHGADPNAQDHNGNRPLHDAVQYNQEEMVLALLDDDADIDAVNDSGRTPLHCAVRKGLVGMVSLLLENGARTNCVDRFGKKPIEYSSDEKIRDLFR